MYSFQAALTATASEKDEEGISSSLKLRNVISIRTSSFRKNLFYDVYFKETLKGEEFTHLSDFIVEALGQFNMRKNRLFVFDFYLMVTSWIFSYLNVVVVVTNVKHRTRLGGRSTKGARMWNHLLQNQTGLSRCCFRTAETW